jgi:hypothetical protein
MGTVAATAALALTPMAKGDVLVRTEILPIDGVTLTQQEFLTGSTAGRPTRIASTAALS